MPPPLLPAPRPKTMTAVPMTRTIPVPAVVLEGHNRLNRPATSPPQRTVLPPSAGFPR